jgi:surface polysaccharide O-acyltransferase-like enzyme
MTDAFHALFFIYKLTYFYLFSPLIALNSPTTPLSFIAILSIFLILITTGSNQLIGTIPTEIGQLTALTQLYLGKYDGCLRSFHALFFIYKLTYFVLFSPLITLNSPTTRLSFIAILSIFCNSYYNRHEPAFWDHSYGNRTIDSAFESISM